MDDNLCNNFSEDSKDITQEITEVTKLTFDTLTAMLKDIEKRDELFISLAKIYKKMFSALLREEFTSTEAMSIIASFTTKFDSSKLGF